MAESDNWKDGANDGGDSLKNRVVQELQMLSLKVGSIIEKSQGFTNEVNCLKNNINCLIKRIELPENQNKTGESEFTNVLVFKGIPATKKYCPLEMLTDTLKTYFNMTDPKCVINAHFMKPTKTKHVIKAEFKERADVKTIYSSVKNLEGSGITVDLYLPYHVYRRKNILLMIKQELVTQKCTQKISIRDDSMIIEKKIFKWSQDNRLLHEGNDGVEVIEVLTGINLKSYFEKLELSQKVIIKESTEESDYKKEEAAPKSEATNSKQISNGVRAEPSGPIIENGQVTL